MAKHMVFKKEQKVAKINHRAIDLIRYTASRSLPLATQLLELFLQQLQALAQFHGQQHQFVVRQTTQIGQSEMGIQRFRLKDPSRQGSRAGSRLIIHG